VISNEDAKVTEADWYVEVARHRRLGQIIGVTTFFLVPALVFPATLLANIMSSGGARYALGVAWMVLLVLPMNLCIFRVADRQNRRSNGVITVVTRQLVEAVERADSEAAQRDRHAHRQEFESRLASALEMADGEPEVIAVIERALTIATPESPVELLLADNSHAHLVRMATASPTSEPPGCSVDSPDHCPAARRAQTQHFSDSQALEACPKLRDRPQGPVSAVCVPVSIMGRTVGVIHATGTPLTRLPDDNLADLGTIATLAGARIGLLRVMAETQLQAATDSLTGLPNRRSFQQQLSAVRRTSTTLSLAMADLDHFKTLNDTYGHDTGDRALLLFAQVLRDSLRAPDLLCRHGGEEFVIAFPACTADNARVALDATRARLDAAITVAGLPKYTVSFGVIEAAAGEDLPGLIGRADAALYDAKHHGRDQVVVHDHTGRAPSPSAPARELPDQRGKPTVAPA